VSSARLPATSARARIAATGRRSCATEPDQSRTAKWPPSWRISRNASRAETPSLARLRSAAVRAWVRCRCWSLRLRFRWNRARSPLRSDIPLRYSRNQDRAVPFHTHSEPDRAVRAETHSVELPFDDALLLCSDGLTEMLSHSDITDVLHGEPNPEVACTRLISLANDRGGQDNITAIVARFSAPRAVRANAIPQRTADE
jgi:hypothetical protein